MKRLGVVTVCALLAMARVSAHHSAAAFDTTSPITLQGTVSRFDWTNPHVYVYVTTTQSGRPTEWMIESDSTSILTRSGWSATSVPVGAMVTVRVSPDKNPQRHHALLVTMALPNGTELRPRVNGPDAVAPATSLAGVWNSLRGFTQRRIGALRPTPKGQAAATSYTEAENPVARCVPYATPFLMGLPYLNQIEMQKDRMVIHSEFLNVDRTVYLDGRGHPKDGPRTLQGHSIGRWEGDVLVVDTTLFSDHRLGNYVGAGTAREFPSGPQKHVVERFRLSDDRKHLLIDAVIEDPEYLVAPLTVGMEWDYAPQSRLLKIGCEPSQSQRYLFR